jgi:hypothetical protein
MKSFNEFIAEAKNLSATADRLSKKASKSNSIEDHENAQSAHRTARYDLQDKGEREKAMYHYGKENEHGKAVLDLKKAKGAGAPYKEKPGIRLHWS